MHPLHKVQDVKSSANSLSAPENTPATEQIPWHALSAEEVLTRLGSRQQGLTSGEVILRLAEYGKNELQDDQPVNPWTIAMRQFEGLLVRILVVAAIISGLLGEWIDALAILLIIAINAIIGFWQEYSAEHSIRALRKITAPKAKAIRNRQVELISASQLVPGDVVELETGDIVPADGRLLAAASFKCLESALTGETLSTNKSTPLISSENTPLVEQSNMVFMGTSVTAGTATCVIVETGKRTQLGRIAELIEIAQAREKTPLEKKLESVGDFLVWACLTLIGVLFILGLIRGFRLFELFLTSISLSVAAVPESLPAVVTIALGVGVMQMARRNALVRRLASVETMGCVSAICCDKTGTLTLGSMTVRRAYVGEQTFRLTGSGYNREGAVLSDKGDPTAAQLRSLHRLGTILVGANNSRLIDEDGVPKAIGEPTEAAMLIAGTKMGVEKHLLELNQPKLCDYPFDNLRKRTSALRRVSMHACEILVNGAPETILDLCSQIYTPAGIRPISPRDKEEIIKHNVAMAADALRIIASAYRLIPKSDENLENIEQLEKDLIFVGLVGMYDPPRPEATPAISACRAAGIQLSLITGDQPATALAVAKELGINCDATGVLTGAELERLTDEELSRTVERISVYARVSPEHKFRIVRAWQAAKKVVAMTGDGINDAPALKAADIGIAMGLTGTEVAKQSSDIIITDDNFASIASAVSQGRGIYDNIRKTLQYLMAGNTGELMLMAACILSNLPLPLLPAHLLWVNLITDGLPALCLATDPVDAEVMKQSPRPLEQKIMDRSFLLLVALTGILTAGVALFAFTTTLASRGLDQARTHAFTVLVLAEIFRSFGCRSTTKFLWETSPLSNLRLTGVVALSFAIQLLMHRNSLMSKIMHATTLPWSDSFSLIAISLVPLVGIEMQKALSRLRSSVILTDD